MKKSECIEYLRKCIELVERIPEIGWGWDIDLSVHGCTASDLRAFIHATGKTEKSASGNTLWVSHHPDGMDRVQLTAFADRDQVCERIVTTKTLPAEPEKVIPAKPERVVEVEEWNCHSILAGQDDRDQT